MIIEKRDMEIVSSLSNFGKFASDNLKGTDLDFDGCVDSLLSRFAFTIACNLFVSASVISSTISTIPETGMTTPANAIHHDSLVNSDLSVYIKLMKIQPISKSISKHVTISLILDSTSGKNQLTTNGIGIIIPLITSNMDRASTQALGFAYENEYN